MDGPRDDARPSGPQAAVFCRRRASGGSPSSRRASAARPPPGRPRGGEAGGAVAAPRRRASSIPQAPAGFEVGRADSRRTGARDVPLGRGGETPVASAAAIPARGPLKLPLPTLVAVLVPVPMPVPPPCARRPCRCRAVLPVAEGAHDPVEGWRRLIDRVRAGASRALASVLEHAVPVEIGPARASGGPAPPPFFAAMATGGGERSSFTREVHAHFGSAVLAVIDAGSRPPTRRRGPWGRSTPAVSGRSWARQGGGRGHPAVQEVVRASSERKSATSGCPGPGVLGGADHAFRGGMNELMPSGADAEKIDHVRGGGRPRGPRSTGSLWAR